jgi:branched-chain amino acid transport system ATP-binding protein
VCGVYRPQEGEILFEEKRVQGRRGVNGGPGDGCGSGPASLFSRLVPMQGLRPYQSARSGIARTFQNLRLFRQISVVENVKAAMSVKAGYGLVSALFRAGRFGREEERLEAQSLALLETMGLLTLRHEMAGSLAYGEQRRLELARALALEPRLLLLDEPAAGMNPRETHDLMHLILRIREERNLSILIIEHDMRVVMGICEKVTVLDHGVKISEGAGDAVRKDPIVIKAYLGEE